MGEFKIGSLHGCLGDRRLWAIVRRDPLDQPARFPSSPQTYVDMRSLFGLPLGLGSMQKTNGRTGVNTYTRNPKTRHFHQVFTWCAACERVHSTQAWAELAWQCPRCRAPAIDARPWEEFLRSHPDHPEIPAVGQVYAWDPEPDHAVGDSLPVVSMAA